MENRSLLLWIDLEMTGLDSHTDVILEVAALLTTFNGMELIDNPVHGIIYQTDGALKKMNEWVKNQHQKSGLTEQVLQSKISIGSIDEQIAHLLQRHNCEKQSVLLCGNSVWQDRAFIIKYMPLTAGFLHYRIIDVSTIKELIRRWYPENETAIFIKKESHRAVDDILESIAELRHYKKHFFLT
ncbi:oligoribonuclease [bacterium]|nr:MAG: oligoribonuclease [bacterium]QQR61440.1 MAG: oligoribonuclease [bacterium]QQR63035.1 MAG: oligoribonuclease [bacterium]